MTDPNEPKKPPIIDYESNKKPLVRKRRQRKSIFQIIVDTLIVGMLTGSTLAVLITYLGRSSESYGEFVVLLGTTISVLIVLFYSIAVRFSERD